MVEGPTTPKLRRTRVEGPTTPRLRRTKVERIEGKKERKKTKVEAKRRSRANRGVKRQK